VPGIQEGIERCVGLARVVLERLGDELAVGVEVLDALGGLEELGDLGGDKLGALLKDQVAVEVRRCA